MKHIKSINEFRTIGFKYSEPKLGFTISFDYNGEVSEEDISDILNNMDIKFTNIDINENKKRISIEGRNIDLNGSIKIDINIYNEKDLSEMIKEISRSLYSIFDVSTINHNVKEHKSNLKQK